MHLAVFFFFFSFSLILPSTLQVIAASASTIRASASCERQSCGGVSIEYPFWLSGRQPSYCGPAPFEVTCRNRTGLSSIPVIGGLNADLYVKGIFYDNQSLLLTSARFADDVCPFPYYTNYTAGFFPFSPANSSNKRIFFLVNCSASTNLSSYPYQRITCPPLPLPAYFAGVPTLGEPELEPAARSCVLVEVPTVEYAQGNYSDLLRAGWLMSWTESDCAPCKESGGQCGYNVSQGKFLCICGDRNDRSSCSDGTGSRRSVGTGSRRRTVILIIIGSSFVFGGLSLCLLLILLRRRRNEENDKAVKALLSLHGPSSLTPKNYKYSEIKRMTESFRTELGRGGYGTVYRGALPDGHQVAVKLLRTEARGSSAEEFVNEVVGISRTSHVNIVGLLGFCIERSKTALVYEFMPNGSLEKFISPPQLGWEKLLDVALGVARGLEYLHRGCSTRIVHLDIKPQNVLLDRDFCPKISDFGLAKLCSPKESSGFSMVTPRGTIGYVAPEVFSRNFGTVSSKSDVYSYGMLVLEMVGVTRMKETAGHPRAVGSGGSSAYSEDYFPHWIYDRLGGTNTNFLGSIACSGTEQEEEIVRKMVIVGLWCIQMMPVNRPSMSLVVDMLQGCTQDLEMPPKP